MTRFFVELLVVVAVVVMTLGCDDSSSIDSQTARQVPPAAASTNALTSAATAGPVATPTETLKPEAQASSGRTVPPRDIDLPLEDRSTSTAYDFRLELRRPREEARGRRLATGIVTVFPKGDARALQRARIDNIEVDAARSEFTPFLSVGDFNFDGREDFAVHNENSACYGAPSYAVFLADPRTSKFVPSAELSALTMHSLNFFDLDVAARRLSVSCKSGCCSHWTETYSVHGNVPRLVAQEYWEGDLDKDCIHRIDTRLPSGKWKRGTESACSF